MWEKEGVAPRILNLYSRQNLLFGFKFLQLVLRGNYVCYGAGLVDFGDGRASHSCRDPNPHPWVVQLAAKSLYWPSNPNSSYCTRFIQNYQMLVNMQQKCYYAVDLRAKEDQYAIFPVRASVTFQKPGMIIVLFETHCRTSIVFVFFGLLLV